MCGEAGLGADAAGSDFVLESLKLRNLAVSVDLLLPRRSWFENFVWGNTQRSIIHHATQFLKTASPAPTTATRLYH